MKQIILILCLFFSLYLDAQITQGFWMLGGEVRFYSMHSSQEDGYDFPRSNGLNLSPDIGYFFKDNIVIGVKAGLDITSASKGISGGPFIRYYFLEAEKILNIFIESRAGYGYTKPKDNTIESFNSYSYGVKGGTVVFLNENIGLEFVLDYSKGKNIQAKINYDNFYATIGLQIHLKNYNEKFRL